MSSLISTNNRDQWMRCSFVLVFPTNIFKNTSLPIKITFYSVCLKGYSSFQPLS